MRSPTLPSRTFLLGGALLLAGACAPGANPQRAADARAWPPGTVLAVEDLAISADEVDEASAWVQPIDRKASSPHLRRLALTNVVLPLKVGQLLAPPGAREEALEHARKAHASLLAGTWVGPPGSEGTWGERLQGGFKLLGIPTWAVAQGLPTDAWSEPFEVPGAFVLVRRLRTQPGAVPLATEVEVDRLVYPYLDAATAPGEIEQAYDRLRLTIVDPAWRELVPELLQYRMGVHRS